MRQEGLLLAGKNGPCSNPRHGAITAVVGTIVRRSRTNRLTRLKYTTQDLLRLPHLTLDEVNEIAAEVSALAEKANDLVRRRKGEADPTGSA